MIKKLYTLVIESPRGEIYHDCIPIEDCIVNKWQYAKRYVKLVYDKGFLLCDMYRYS